MSPLVAISSQLLSPISALGGCETGEETRTTPKGIGDDITTFEVSSLATLGAEAPDGIQCMWEGSAQRS